MVTKIFPKDFIFGTAVASYQVEGGIYNNDWTYWENKKNTVCAEPCNDACKHYEFYREDINLLDDLGIRAFRFSIEWSRIEPQEGQYDLSEINHYVDKSKLLLEKNITPIVTFHHFTTPEWLMNDGLWTSEKISTAFINCLLLTKSEPSANINVSFFSLGCVLHNFQIFCSISSAKILLLLSFNSLNNLFN